MALLKSHKHTLTAGCMGYITQAIVVNFAPLLFLIFQDRFAITLSQIALLSTINFGVQLLTDLAAAHFVDKIGYRVCVVTAHLFCIAGLIGLAVFPARFSNHYAGLILSIVIYAIGGGLIEVLVSPIIEACPTRSKAKMMGVLHSFYCWGMVFVILTTTLLLSVAKLPWETVALLWAVVPAAAAVYFCFVPIYPLVSGNQGFSLRKLFTVRLFWLFMVLMMCAGAAEQAIAQWASAFSEAGLGISKATGDLLGPCLFAVLMGAARLCYAKFSERINLRKILAVSAAVCVAGYLVMSFSPWPALSLVGCGMVGLSVAALWPGVFSMAAKGIPKGGTALFAMLALAGDAGCSLGPFLVGTVSDAAGGTLQWGILAAIVFPLALVVILLLYRRFDTGRRREDEASGANGADTPPEAVPETVDA